MAEVTALYPAVCSALAAARRSPESPGVAQGPEH
jgi:hypothetical protein